MTETHKLEPSAGIGGNFPPADPFLARLEEENSDLLSGSANLEMEVAALPAEVTSDEHVATITAFVTRARKFARIIEERRKMAGEEPLKMTRTINGFFTGISRMALERASSLEARSGPYLNAKRERQEAEAREAARRAREEQERQEADARAAREAQEKAAREAAEAEARLKAAAAAADAKATAAAQEEMRVAGLEVTRQAEAAAAAEKAAEASEKQADRNTTVAEGGHALVKTGAGGNVRTVTTYDPVIADRPALLASMGPIAMFIQPVDIDKALQRAAKMPNLPVIPGVNFVPNTAVKTSRTKD